MPKVLCNIGKLLSFLDLEGKGWEQVPVPKREL